jgi:hypothetical protein
MADSPDERQEIADRSLLRRPEHAPPHERFFEDGEEPPVRYDLSDELAYILPVDYKYDEAKWFRVARKHFWHQWAEFVGDVFVYLGVLFILGICSFGLLAIAFEPLLRCRLLSRNLRLLSGRPDEVSTPAKAWWQSARMVGCQLPAYICWLGTAVALLLALGSFDASATPTWKMVGLTGATICLAVLSLFIHVRLCGFAFEFAFDHELDVIQGLQGSWRMTGPHAWRFIELKMRLWLLIVLVGTVTLGLGVLFALPYASLVWTAAYLDIAGSEEILEEPGAESPQTLSSPTTT